MVRKLRKPVKGLEGLEELEKSTDKEVADIHKIRAQDFKNEMNLAFFFSVVFDTRKERDKWLKEHGLTLTEDFFIKARDFKV